MPNIGSGCSLSLMNFLGNLSSVYFVVYSLTLSCLPIYPMPSLKVFYQNMDYYNELNIYQKVLNEFRPNFAETWRGIELSKNIKILVTFDLHSRSRDPRWPPNTFFKVKFGPQTTHNSANFWSNSIIFVLFCCWRPVLHFEWKSNTNNGSMCLLAPEKRPSYTTLWKIALSPFSTENDGKIDPNCHSATLDIFAMTYKCF